MLAAVLKLPDSIKQAVQGFTLTPVVRRPQERVIEYESSGFGPIAFSTFFKASFSSSSSSPSPATFAIVNWPKTGCSCKSLLKAFASFTPGIIQSE